MTLRHLTMSRGLCWKPLNPSHMLHTHTHTTASATVNVGIELLFSRSREASTLPPFKVTKPVAKRLFSVFKDVKRWMPHWLLQTKQRIASHLHTKAFSWRMDIKIIDLSLPASPECMEYGIFKMHVEIQTHWNCVVDVFLYLKYCRNTFVNDSIPLFLYYCHNHCQLCQEFNQILFFHSHKQSYSL